MEDNPYQSPQSMEIAPEKKARITRRDKPNWYRTNILLWFVVTVVIFAILLISVFSGEGWKPMDGPEALIVVPVLFVASTPVAWLLHAIIVVLCDPMRAFRKK
jgi:polyferredoxin